MTPAPDTEGTLSTTIEAPDAPTDAPAGDWVFAREAARICGLPEKRIPEAARMGYLTVRRPPAGLGGMTKYSRASVEGLATAMITQATLDAAPDPPERRLP